LASSLAVSGPCGRVFLFFFCCSYGTSLRPILLCHTPWLKAEPDLPWLVRRHKPSLSLVFSLFLETTSNILSSRDTLEKGYWRSSFFWRKALLLFFFYLHPTIGFSPPMWPIRSCFYARTHVPPQVPICSFFHLLCQGWPTFRARRAASFSLFASHRAWVVFLS